MTLIDNIFLSVKSCQLWNILDFVMLSTFITSFSLKIVSYRNVVRNYSWWDQFYMAHQANSSSVNIKCDGGLYFASQDFKQKKRKVNWGTCQLRRNQIRNFKKSTKFEDPSAAELDLGSGFFIPELWDF